MPRPADPERRRAVVDAVIDQLARTGVSGFTMRGVAQGLGRSTRVLTHHFADREALVTAVLERLDERQHAALRATPGWDDPSVPVSAIVRDSWRRHLGPELEMTRLLLEIEGLTAGGRLSTRAGFARGRAEFVARCLRLRGVPGEEALTRATLLNAAYSGLEADYLTTGDRERVEAALDALCAWLDSPSLSPGP
ncbi:TetR family transcriptional regulator [Nocardiopsis sp. TSRI0078]|uniref:TetR/AcrR family transcriptional regulator n=1 Tax=unclassified Nocardiopsis TaxID=2649073 RepID=UPI00093FF5D8|nr:TetR/AcrR family transcriptional regulator [Nocardiopsis sp. TSRI0078]OKI15687.1 TetR family transcriptional regulator [Nocardiopsis sp. TSRI0078]